jgi:hypothetical protein
MLGSHGNGRSAIALTKDLGLTLVVVVSGDVVHRAGQCNIERGQSAGIMRRQCDVDPVPDIEPFGMMIHFFSDERRARHKSKGRIEVLEFEAAKNGVAIANDVPERALLECFDAI